MKLILTEIHKNLNRAYLKQNINREQINTFKANLKILFSKAEIAEKKKEHEEHFKNIVSEFLKDTYYKNNFEININKRKDLVIHNGSSSSDSVGVIIEAKKPSNEIEMISQKTPNSKALHELLHYYMQERFINNNKEIKHIIATNSYDWYIFDAADFERFFYDNKKIRKSYEDWNNGVLVGSNTDWFYNEVAKPYIDKELEELECVYINLLDYAEIVKNADQEDDSKLINLYKILSPEHLLKLPFANDYNKIDAGFYNELLHILGLEETKQGGKKIIAQIKEKSRLSGSLLENTIEIIQSKHRLEHIERLDLYGETAEDQLFSIALELNITWLNRILFLKLLEAQLIKYHKGNISYAFLNTKKITDFGELDELFFEVLAKKPENRTTSVNEKFGDLPYLNSSLFEQTELEYQVLYIGNLKGRLSLPLSKTSVLKDKQGNRLNGELNTLEYLFQFLDAYSFASDTTAEIQDNSRTIINAAVLGLIFEKINGYKDGSFYTPSFITTYMSREIIKNTLVTNFSKAFNKSIKDFEQLKELIEYTDKEERQKANNIINSLKIVDPAVGSGHFLVSVLNELVALKSELRILQDQNRNRLKGILIINVNDELVIVNQETSLPFQYYVNEKHLPPIEIQEIQQALFNEKRTLIENCLFGVDINPKSVLICRLRLWIELLKNSFYTPESNYKYLETLPNIDMNIKPGNSLISKFDTGLNIFERAAVNKWIVQYKMITDQYKTSTDYDQKQKYRKTIQNIKNELLKYAIPQDKYYKLYLKKSRELQNLIEIKPQSEAITKQIVKLSAEVNEHEKKYLDNYYHVYANSLEWAIDFPEILSENGEFVGFDIVIGNPPYFTISNEPKLKEVSDNYSIFKSTADIYTLFIERGMQILKHEGKLCMITSNKWLRTAYGESLRNYLLSEVKTDILIDFGTARVFDEATVDTNILFVTNKKHKTNKINAVGFEKSFKPELDNIENYIAENTIELSNLTSESWNIVVESEDSLKSKIEKIGKPISNFGIEINRGILTGYNEAFIIDNKKKDELIDADPKNAEIIKPLLRGIDIKKYYAQNTDLWLINTYNGYMDKIENEVDDIIKNSENDFIYTNDLGVKKNAKHIEKSRAKQFRINRIIVEQDYPMIYEFLKTFDNQLIERTDKGVHWSNLRNCAYDDQFAQEKIMWQAITKKFDFHYDTQGLYSDVTTFIMTGENLKYILAILNSKFFTYCMDNIYLLGDTFRSKNLILQNFPIPLISEENKATVNKIEVLVNNIIAIKEKSKAADISEQTGKIDKLVYKLYELTNEEIAIIES